MIIPILAISITALFVLLMLSQEDEFGWPYGGDDYPPEDDVLGEDRARDRYGESDDGDRAGEWGDFDGWQNDSTLEEDSYDCWSGEDTWDQDSRH